MIVFFLSRNEDNRRYRIVKYVKLLLLIERNNLHVSGKLSNSYSFLMKEYHKPTHRLNEIPFKKKILNSVCTEPSNSG
jgi:hypothetical protein